MTSTSLAAQYVKEHPEEKIAAIANEAVRRKYGLTIVRRSIHTHKNNHTRFLVLHKKRKQYSRITERIAERKRRL